MPFCSVSIDFRVFVKVLQLATVFRFQFLFAFFIDRRLKKLPDKLKDLGISHLVGIRWDLVAPSNFSNHSVCELGVVVHF